MIFIKKESMNEILNNYTKIHITVGFQSHDVIIDGPIFYAGTGASKTEIYLSPDVININGWVIRLYAIKEMEYRMTQIDYDLSDLIRFARYYATFNNDDLGFVRIDLIYAYPNHEEFIKINKMVFIRKSYPSIKKYFKSALLEKCPQMAEFLADLILEYDNPDIYMI